MAFSLFPAVSTALWLNSVMPRARPMLHTTPPPYVMHCTGRLCVIVEYCAKGSLLSWLRARRSTAVGDILTISGELIGMARQVAVGMEFLESKNVRSITSSLEDTLPCTCIPYNLPKPLTVLVWA